MNHNVNLDHQSCPDIACKNYQKKDNFYIRIHSKKQKRFRCSLCSKTWVQHRNEPYYGLKHSYDKLKNMEMFADFGLSVRQIARRIKVSPSTVQRWKSLI